MVVDPASLVIYGNRNYSFLGYLSRVVLEFTRSVDDVVVGEAEQNRKESDSDEVEVTDVLKRSEGQ